MSLLIDLLSVLAIEVLEIDIVQTVKAAMSKGNYTC